jgi:hypothetical protein
VCAANFRVEGSIYLQQGGRHFDLHNDCDFVAFSYSVAERVVELSWLRSPGDWVRRKLPARLVLSCRGVTHLSATGRDKSGTLLTAAQTELLLRAITRKPPNTVDLTNCFSPHHAFVFYDAHQKAVAWVEVCFHCNNIAGHPRTPGEPWADMKALFKLSKQLELPNTPQRQADLTIHLR